MPRDPEAARSEKVRNGLRETIRNVHGIETPTAPAITAGTGGETGEHPTHAAVAADVRSDHGKR